MWEWYQRLEDSPTFFADDSAAVCAAEAPAEMVAEPSPTGACCGSR
jgi:hypothetical protein